MCSGKMKTRWWVFGTNTNQISHLPYWPFSNVSCVLFLFSDLYTEWPLCYSLGHSQGSQWVLIMDRGCCTSWYPGKPILAPHIKGLPACKVLDIGLGVVWEQEGVGWNEGEFAADVAIFLYFFSDFHSFKNWLSLGFWKALFKESLSFIRVVVGRV